MHLGNLFVSQGKLLSETKLNKGKQMNNAIPTDKQTTIKGYKIDIEFEDMGDDYF